MTLADRVDLWSHEYEKKGIEKGEALLLQRLLARRFGPLPSDLVATISTASASQIETWGDRVLDATSLEAVFRVDGFHT